MTTKVRTEGPGPSRKPDESTSDFMVRVARHFGWRAQIWEDLRSVVVDDRQYGFATQYTTFGGVVYQRDYTWNPDHPCDAPDARYVACCNGLARTGTPLRVRDGESLLAVIRRERRTQRRRQLREESL